MRNIKEDINRVVAAFVCYGIAFQPLIASAESIKASGASNVRPTVTQTSLGVPQINITKPSAAGVSKNQYSDFNVSHYGAVFNNSTKDTQSTLGGAVRYNPNLKGNTAKIILNEVRGTKNSKLNGYVEVAGTKADVIIANPNGITCNGCGFVNVPNATLTTGKAQFDKKGNISSYSVNQGNINITGKGLDASRTNKMDLISRTANLNAKIYANELNVKLGKSAENVRATDKKPKVLLDSSALGGMYANSIKLEGTEKGLGVNLPPEIIAGSGGIEIDVNGNIILKNIDSGGDLKATSTTGNVSLEKGKSVYASKRLSINAGESIKINKDARIASHAKAQLTSKNLSNSGNIISGLSSDGSLNSIGSLGINATVNVTNNGSIVSTGDVSINSKKFANTSSGETIAFGGQQVNSDTINNAGSFEAMANLVLQGNTISNTGKVASAKSVAVKAKKLVNKGSMSADELFLLEAARALNIEGTIVGDDIKVTGDELLNDKGQLVATGNISLESTKTTISGSVADKKVATVMAAGSINLASDTFENKNVMSVVSAGNSIVAKKDSAIVNNGNIIANKIVSADWKDVDKTTVGLHQVDKIMAAIDGSVSKNKALISAESIDLSNASLSSLNDIDISADSDVVLGGVEVSKDLSVTASNSVIAKGDIQSDKKVSLLSNGKVSTTNVGISAADLLIAGAKIQTGKLNSSSATSIIGSDSVLAKGSVVAKGNLEVIGANSVILNANVSGNNVNLTTDGSLNTRSVSSSSDSVLLAKKNIKVTGNVISKGNLVVQGGNQVALTGSASATGDLTVSSGNSINIKSGVTSGAALTLVSGDNTTVGGRVYSVNDQVISAGKNINVGKVYSKGSSSLVAKDYLTVKSNATALKDITIGSGKHSYLRGNVNAGNDLLAVVDGNAYFYGFSRAKNNITIHGDKYLYQKGYSAAGKNSQLSSNGNLSAYDRVTAGGDLSLSSTKNVYVKEYAYSGGDQDVSAKGNISLGRAISKGEVNLVSGAATTIGGKGINYSGAGKDFNISAGKTIRSYNNTSAGKDLKITSNDHVYIYKNTSSVGDTLLASGLNTLIKGQVYSKGDQTVSSGGSLNVGNINSRGDAKLLSKGNLVVNFTISALGDVTISSGSNAYLKGNIYSGDDLLAVIDGNAYFYGYSKAKNNLTIHGDKYLYQKGYSAAGKNSQLSSNGNLSAYDRVTAGRDLSLSSTKNVYVKEYAYSGGDQDVSAKGNISLGRAISKGEVNLVSGAATTIGGKGTNYSGAGKDFNISAGKTVRSYNHLSAGNDLNVASNDHVYMHKNTASQGDTVLSSGLNTWVAGQVYSKGDQTVSSDGSLSIGNSRSLSNSRLLSKGNLTVKKTIVASKDITIGAGKNAVINSNIYAGDELIAIVDGKATFNGYVRAVKGNNTIHGEKSLTVNGHLQAGKDLSVTSKGNVVVGGGTYSYTGKTDVMAGKSLDIDGRVYSRKDQLLTAGKDLSAGYITSYGNSTLTSGGTTTLTSGALSSVSKDLEIYSKSDVALKGALSAGRDLVLSTNGSATASKALSAKRDLSIHANTDVYVANKITSGRDLEIATEGNVKLRNTVDSKRDFAVTSGKNITITKTSIDKLNGNRNIALKAGESLGASNLKFKATGNVDIASGNNLSVENIQARTIKLSTDKTFTLKDALRATAGSIGVSAGVDLNIEGKSSVIARTDILLNAGRNINVKAKDRTVFNRVNGLNSHKYIVSDVASITSQKGNIALYADNNITTIGSILSAANSLELNAGNDINLNAAYNKSEYSNTKTVKNKSSSTAKVTNKIADYKTIKFWGWSWKRPIYDADKKTVTSKYSNTTTITKNTYKTAKVSTLKANNKLIISSKDNLTSRGANLTGKKELSLSAGNNLTLGSANNLKENSVTKSINGKVHTTTYKNKAKSYKHKDLWVKEGKTKVNNFSSRASTSKKNTVTKTKTSDLIAYGDIALSAGNALIAPIKNMVSKGALYLSSGENLNVDNVSAANDLTLVSKKSVTVNNSAISGDDLTISTGQDTNLTGTIKARNNLTIAADGNVNLKNQVVKKSWNKTENKKYSVKNVGWHKVNNYPNTSWFSFFRNYSYGTFYTTSTRKEHNKGTHYVNNGANLDATNGSIKISSGKAIFATSATLDAKKDITLLAKGNISLKDAKDVYENTKTINGKSTITSYVNNIGTKLTALTGNISAKSGANILLRGKINAGKDAVLSASRNILIQNPDSFSSGNTPRQTASAGFDSNQTIQAKGNLSLNTTSGNVYLGKEYLSMYTNTGRWYRPKYKRNPTIDDIIANDNSSTIVKLKAGKELNIDSGKDVVMNATVTRSGKDTIVQAKRNLNILNIEHKTEIKKSGGLRSGGWNSTTTKFRNDLGDLYANGNLVLKANGSLNTFGTKLRANENISLFATGSMNLNDIQDQDYYTYYHNYRPKWNSRRRIKHESSADIRNIGTKLDAKESIFINTVDKAGSNNLTVVKSGNVNMSGTTISAKDDINIFSGQHVNMVSGLEFKDSYSKEVKKGHFGIDWLGGSSNSKKTEESYLGHIELKSGNDTTVLSTGDIGMLAGRVDANKITFRAGVGSTKSQTASINILGDRETKKLVTKKVKHKIGLDFKDNMLSVASQTKDIKVDVDSVYVGSQLKARDTIYLDAKTDINVVGSSLNAANNILLTAGNDVNILAAADLHSNKSEHSEKRLGIGINLSASEAEVWAGVRTVKDIITNDASLNKGSELIAGNSITVAAGNNLNKVGSYMMAGGNIFQSAVNNINEYAGVDAQKHTEFHETLEAGIKIGARATGATATALNAADRARTAESDKLKIAKGYQAYSAGEQAIKDYRKGGLDALYEKDGKAGITAFVDYTKTESTNKNTSGVANTTLAGGSVTYIAGNEINLEGSQINAVLDLNLNATDINITSIQQESESDSKTTSASAEATIIGSVSASANASQSTTETTSITHQLASLNAGQNVNITADNVSITGGKILGQAINALVANNLSIESVQDTASLDQETNSANIAVGGGSVSAGVNHSEIEGNRAAVGEQSGLYASGSINLNVGNNTSLVGAVIKSDTEDGVTLNTKTLEFVNLKNSDEIKSSSVGLSASGGKASLDLGNPISDEKDNTTFAAISSGAITTESDTSGLSRDTGNAFSVLGSVKSVTELQEQQELAGVIAEEGFKKLGTEARKKELAGDKDWADGGWKKTVAHSLMGAIVASVAGGDIAKGAVSAGVREALSGLTADTESEFVEQLVSSTIGAIVGGEAGAAISLQGVKYNRQLHPDEIDFLQDDARVKRYIEYVRQSTNGDVVLTEEEARAELNKYGASYADAKWSQINGNSELFNTFISKEATEAGIVYIDSSGKEHGVFHVTTNEFNNEFLNLIPLLESYSENENVQNYLKDNNQEVNIEDFLAEFKKGQQAGYDASVDQSLGEDLSTLLKGLMGLPSHLVESIRNSDVGPLNDAQLKDYYQKLLMLQGRGEEAGYTYEYGYTQEQKMFILSTPLGAGAGKLLGLGIGRLGSTAVPDGVPYFRVQGGGSGSATSRGALTVNPDGSVNITPGCTGTICVSAGSADHAVYYVANKRPNGQVLVFEVDRATHNSIIGDAVPQANNKGAGVQIVDESTSGSATSLQLDQAYSRLMTTGASNGRVMSQAEFIKTYGSN